MRAKILSPEFELGATYFNHNLKLISGHPLEMAGFRDLRRQLDDLGYYQPLVLDAVPLVEALVHDLLATTHNLKVCREESQSYQKKVIHSRQTPPAPENQALPKVHFDEAKVTKLESRVQDLTVLNKECRDIIRRCGH